jgi:hypothetical protein
MKPELSTRFVFGKRIGSTIVDISSDNEQVIIHTREEAEHEDAGSYLFLDPQEIDLFIATLNLYKHKIMNPRKEEDE